jgi:hypothetical protein|tara:strand:+ start:197 stop:391 length:195 start_codon:yes stop_codon:yes gene_type:complete
MQVGDIVTLWAAGERKVIIGVSTEIVPVSDDWSELRARMIYRLAGKADQWFSEQDITIFSARKP